MKNGILFLLIFWALSLGATHNRAGEITYKSLGGRTYEVTITTYTRSCPNCADRCSLKIFWDANDTSKNAILHRQNGPPGGCPNATQGEIVDAANQIQKNVYKGTHTYNTDGVYIVYFEDQFRNADIVNVPNSLSVPFYVQSEIFISSSLGPNSSPILLNPPVDEGCKGRRFEHNAGAYDPDGDSLAYELVQVRGTNGNQLPSTYDSQLVQDSVTLNRQTGDLIWDTPQRIGEFNFAFRITEYRKNSRGNMVQVGYVVRDMQIQINDCGNNPPEIKPVGPFCVEAGQTLNFDVTATDPDGDPVTLTAFGGPFAVSNPADPFMADGPEPVTATFNWNTACNHVRKQPYNVTFRAEDDPDDSVGIPTPLVDLYTTEITVIAPPPENPSAVANANSIDLKWDQSICPGATSYKIYRREGTYGFVPDSCETGVPAYTGYELIATNNGGLSDTTYTDTSELKRGVRYCYMVVAVFPDGAESYASVEFCASLPLSLPLMTKVDVDTTDPVDGIINVDWIAPPELDSSLNPPPYSYKLYRSEGINGTDYTELQTFNGLQNTGYVDSGLNTEGTGYRYRVTFLSSPQTDSVGSADAASSVYLNATGTDQSVALNFSNNTPWQNQRFIVFKEIPTGSGNYDSIAETFSPSFADTGLVNGQEYCYRVRSFGRYTADDSLPHPLINNSQIACATARDTTAPCAPEFSLRTVCPDSVYLSWEVADEDSSCSNDIVKFNIYFRPPGGSFGDTPFMTINSNNDSTISFAPDADFFGCYAITAVDDAGGDLSGQANESELSEAACLQSCSDIQFPNIFSPNNDNINDFFLPINANDIDELSIEIYNRWGTIVYEAGRDEFLNNGWNGNIQSTGQPAPEGVYFYVANYLPQALDSPQQKVAKGFVHLVR